MLAAAFIVTLPAPEPTEPDRHINGPPSAQPIAPAGSLPDCHRVIKQGS